MSKRWMKKSFIMILSVLVLLSGISAFGVRPVLAADADYVESNDTNMDDMNTANASELPAASEEAEEAVPCEELKNEEINEGQELNEDSTASVGEIAEGAVSEEGKEDNQEENKEESEEDNKEENNEESKEDNKEEVTKEESEENSKDEEKSDTDEEAEEGKKAKKSNRDYGTPTGNQGIANESGNVTFTEYEKDGEYVMVFSVEDPERPAEECAITTQYRYSAYTTRTNRIVLEEGITGIGWTYLYDRGNYEPQYPETYTIDQSKTDIFRGFTKLTAVETCSTLQRIGWSAFRECSNLRSFDFSTCTDLLEILNQAFNNCKNLNVVDLSGCGQLTLIGWSAFKGAGKGSSVELVMPANGSLAVIGGYAFNEFGKSAGTVAVDFSGIASSLEQVLQNAFVDSAISGDLSNLTALTTLGNAAFKNTKITGIQISANVTKMANSAFSGCKMIENVIWNAENHKGMNGNEFTSASSFTLTIGANVKSLPNNFFKAMAKANDIYFEGIEGGHLISMNSNATNGAQIPIANITRPCFVDAQGIVYEQMSGYMRVAYCAPGVSTCTIPATITLPGEEQILPVTEIAPAAFKKARDLNEVIFENTANITGIGESAFENLTELTYVTDLTTGMSAVSIPEAELLFAEAAYNNAIPESAFRNTGLAYGIRINYEVRTVRPLGGSSVDESTLPAVEGGNMDAFLSNSQALYTVKDLTSYYYQTIRESTHFPIYTYEFKGWIAEDGSLIEAGSQITAEELTGTSFDANGDHVITLAAAWVGTWNSETDSTGTPSANFSIWRDAQTADTYIENKTLLKEDVSCYTQKLGGAIMHATDDEGNIIYSDELASPAVSNGTQTNKFFLISYLEEDDLETTDAKIRQLTTSGVTVTDERNGEVNWVLSSIPEDEEVLSTLAQMVSDGTTELKDDNGDVIAAEELTTDNFKVEWFVVKYQSGRDDGFNINGKLTRIVHAEMIPAPTGISFQILPYIILLAAGAGIALLILLKRKNKARS